MNVLFLDIDGVLNSESDFRFPDGRRKQKAPRLHLQTCDVYNGIAQPKVKRLRRIVDATGAKIVLISSWKAWYEESLFRKRRNAVASYLVRSLAAKGLEIHSTTLGFEDNEYQRAEGILNWIADHDLSHPDDPVEGIAILDDEDFGYDESGLGHLWVKTHYHGLDPNESGLSDDKADEAIELINNKEKPRTRRERY